MATPQQTDIVVIGAGPGGYAAAFYAAEKGKRVILVEQDEHLGGVCLQRGCIPSKALLHASAFMTEAKETAVRGIEFGKPVIHLDKMRDWKNGIVQQLAQGVATLAKERKVIVLKGRGFFEGFQMLRVETSSGQQFVQYDKAILAVGSNPAMPSVFDLGNKRIMTSTEALELEEIPNDLLVVGGGYIGLELGTVYAALGSKVVLVEATASLLSGLDLDLIRPVVRRAEKAFKEIRLSVKVSKMATAGKKIRVTIEREGKKVDEMYDRVLVAVGRTPNCNDLGLENTKITRDDRGFVKVNKQQQTSDLNIYAIGDVVGGAMLAHKASKEARIAVEAILGESATFEGVVIPAVVFTNPEIAWCGLTESEARAKNIAIEVARFPWGASGRALTLDRTDGMTKLVLEPETERILGVGIVGVHAGDLISEGVLAVEMGATATDLAETVHPHPTLSETLMECAENFFGTSTHVVNRRKRV